MKSLIKFFIKWFTHKTVVAFFAIAVISVVAYQNCARVKFSGNKNLVSLACEAPDRECETATGYGREVCNETANGSEFGVCIMDRCKTGFTYNPTTRACDPNGCNPGDVISCPVDNGTGTRQCVNGVFSPTCNITCDAGFFLDVGLQNCRANFVHVNNVVSFRATAIQNQTYAMNVTASPNTVLTVTMSRVSVVGGDCVASRTSQNSIAPFLDTNTSFQMGANSWHYSPARAQLMAGCEWESTVSGTTPGDPTVRTAKVILQATCAVGSAGTESCPVGQTSRCFDSNNDGVGDGYRCESGGGSCTNGATNYPQCNQCPANWNYDATNRRCEQTPCQGILVAQNGALVCTCPGGGTATFTNGAWRCPSTGGSCSVSPIVNPTPPPNSVPGGSIATRFGVVGTATSCGSRSCQERSFTCDANTLAPIVFPDRFVYATANACQSAPCQEVTTGKSNPEYGPCNNCVPNSGTCGQGTCTRQLTRCRIFFNIVADGIVIGTGSRQSNNPAECTNPPGNTLPATQPGFCGVTCPTCNVTLGTDPTVIATVINGQAHQRYRLVPGAGTCGAKCQAESRTCAAPAVINFPGVTYADQAACTAANPCSQRYEGSYGNCQTNAQTLCVNGQRSGTQNLVSCRLITTVNGVDTITSVPLSECVNNGVSSMRSCSVPCAVSCPAGQQGTPPNCSCINGGTVASNCTTCANPNQTFPGCATCINPSLQFPNCNTCINGNPNTANCSQCPSGQTGAWPNCSAPNCTNGALNPPDCNQCAQGQTYHQGRCQACARGSGSFNPTGNPDVVRLTRWECGCNFDSSFMSQFTPYSNGHWEPQPATAPLACFHKNIECEAGYTLDPNGNGCFCQNGAVNLPNVPACSQCPAGQGFHNGTCQVCPSGTVLNGTQCVAMPVVTGVCGTANGTYTLAALGNFSGTTCVTGIQEPFLLGSLFLPGYQVNWTCRGQNGGSSASCAAYGYNLGNCGTSFGTCVDGTPQNQQPAQGTWICKGAGFSPPVGHPGYNDHFKQCSMSETGGPPECRCQYAGQIIQVYPNCCNLAAACSGVPVGSGWIASYTCRGSGAGNFWVEQRTCTSTPVQPSCQ